MSKPQLSFYMTKKRTLLLIVFFCLFLTALEIMLWFTTDDVFTELQSLLRNQYEYSVVMQESEGINDYYQYNASIRYSMTPDSEKAFKVDVIMQTEHSEYDSNICWNTSRLNSDSIAITQSIARTHGISVGDNLYSKHIVDGKIHEYTVVQILPNIVNVRYEDDLSHNSGVIVMGYDPLYEENITHNVIVFTKKPINELTQNNSKSALDILYREDEIISVIKDLLPFVLLFVLLRIACCIGFVVLMTIGLSENFKRYVMLGYHPNSINWSYYQNVMLRGCLIELGFVVANIALVICCVLCLPELILLVISNMIEMIVIISTSIVFRKKLWRR